MEGFVIKGDICYSGSIDSLKTIEDGYLVCVDGRSEGAFSELPDRFRSLPVVDYSGNLIIPGLTDLHMHAPQFAFRGLGMDLELLEWLNTHTFPEESKYADTEYAARAYGALVSELKRGPNTRACVFATLHLPATKLLMQLLESSGLVTMVGKVNMDRNCPDGLCEADAETSLSDTRRWLEEAAGSCVSTTPILTPRFIPTCSDELMYGLSQLQKEFKLPVQSHLSENRSEIEWVAELCPESRGYADAYAGYGLLGENVPAIMAHCVWSDDDEISLLREKGVYVAHCPQSNVNLSSGIAPIRRFLDEGIKVGLGSDVAGGCHTSIFRAMADAIQVSKLRWSLINHGEAPLTLPEAFYLGTVGSGSFFGKVGSFESGYEFDAVILDDKSLKAPFECGVEQRVERVVYLSDDRHIRDKFVRGRKILL